MSSEKDAQKETTGTATVVEEVSKNGATLDVLDIDARIQQMAGECPPFYKNHNLFILYLLIIPGCLVPAVTLGFDSAMLNGLQAVEPWDLYFDRPRGSKLGIMSAILPLGAVVASPLVGIVGDRWGRRFGIFLGGAIMCVGGIIQGASIHFVMFLMSRFILGVGLVFANSYAPILIGELAHPKDRQVATSLYQTSWYCDALTSCFLFTGRSGGMISILKLTKPGGAVAAAWTTFGTFNIPSDWSWRIPSLLQAVPAMIQMVGVFCLPESPRWLIAKGRHEQAKADLIKWHANGNEKDPFVDLEFKQMRSIVEAELTVKTTWKTLIATPGNRKRIAIVFLLGVFSQWSGNGLVSYYLVRVLETVGIESARDKNVINGSLMIFNWITAVISAFLTAKLKRRTQFLISGFGMLTLFATQTLCAGLFNERGNTAAGHAVIAMLFLFYMFYNLAFNALLYSYPVEVLPYPIRAKGFAVLMFSGKAATFINILVNPIGLQALGWKYYIVYVVWLCIECGLIWKLFVETKGPGLEAIAALFDGDAVKQVHADGFAEKADAHEKRKEG